MQRLIFFTITIITLCISICSCEPEKSSSNSSSGNELIPEMLSNNNQVLKQVSRRVIVGGSEIGKKEKTVKYAEEGNLQFYAEFDYTDFKKEEKDGIVKVNIYSDENKKNKIGYATYTYNKANKTMLMEVFRSNNEVADAAEYFEYLDDNFEWYTKFSQYLPAQENKITYYKTATFNSGTYDFIEETNYVTNGLVWNPETHEPDGTLKILEKITCEYNDTVIPDTNGKQHQWIREIQEVNSYNVTTGENLSKRKFLYDFLWNENICQDNHVQQNSFELDLEDNTIISANEIIIKSFQKYNNKYKLKRKNWMSAECETKYYYEYEYALFPNQESDYYLTSEKWISISNGSKIIKNEKRYLYYNNTDNKLIYEEIELQAQSSRSNTIINTLDLSLMPKKYSRGS